MHGLEMVNAGVPVLCYAQVIHQRENVDVNTIAVADIAMHVSHVILFKKLQFPLLYTEIKKLTV